MLDSVEWEADCCPSWFEFPVEIITFHIPNEKINEPIVNLNVGPNRFFIDEIIQCVIFKSIAHYCGNGGGN